MHTFAHNEKRPPQPASFTLKKSSSEASGGCAPQAFAQTTAKDREVGSGAIAITRFDHDFSRIPVRGNVPARAPATTGTATGDEAGGGGGELVKPDEAAGVEPLGGNLPGSPNACIVKAEIPFSRSGIIRSSTGTVGENFEVRVEWRSAPAVTRGETSYCAAECGEYHQFIKGHMKSSAYKDGSNLTDVSGNVFGGQPLDENVFREDGLDRNPKARYGHRKEPLTMDEEYKPDRIAGPKYVGRDFPNVSIGTFADIDLTFLGKLVDTCNGTETSSDPWRVQYRGVIRP